MNNLPIHVPVKTTLSATFRPDHTESFILTAYRIPQPPQSSLGQHAAPRWYNQRWPAPYHCRCSAAVQSHQWTQSSPGCCRGDNTCMWWARSAPGDLRGNMQCLIFLVTLIGIIVRRMTKVMVLDVWDWCQLSAAMTLLLCKYTWPQDNCNSLMAVRSISIVSYIMRRICN